MRFQKVVVDLSRSIDLTDGRIESISLSYTVLIDDENEDPQEVYSSVYRLINLQLNSWERELRQEIQKNLFLASEPPPITTAASMIQINNKDPKSDLINKDPEVLCPECGEKMFQKDGKSYFTCVNKHWGYLEMIKKGEVRISGN
jgi:uncharacterized C2H2 Zn-finger protein